MGTINNFEVDGWSFPTKRKVDGPVQQIAVS
jgi:hypothetical protein